jgi:hypothetical protein
MGTGDICALIMRSVIITSNKSTGIIQILLDFERRVTSCLIVENIIQ